MAFQSNLVKDIHVCQHCSGFGVINPDDPLSKHKDCPSCTEDGVFIKKGNEYFIFGMPPFVDYKGRERRKQVLIISTGVSILLTILLILYFVSI